MTVTTGMSISGKTSVRIRADDRPPRTRMSIASTTNEYGRRRASLTIHMARDPFGQEGSGRATAWGLREGVFVGGDGEGRSGDEDGAGLLVDLDQLEGEQQVQL